jgi:hypothetical protein
VPLDSARSRSAPAGAFTQLSPSSHGSACRTRRASCCIQQAGYARFVCTCGRRRARGRRARRSSKASATAAQHARSLSRECRRRVTGAPGVAASLTASVTATAAVTYPAAARVGSVTALNTSREPAATSSPGPDPMRLLSGTHVRERAFSDVPDVRSRSLPRTDSETMSRGAFSLAVGATSGRLDRRSTSRRSPTVSAGRTEGGSRAVSASADGSGRRRSSCTIFSSVPT